MPDKRIPFAFDTAVKMIPARVAEINQTVTQNGVPVTLERMLVTPTETRVFVKFYDANGATIHEWFSQSVTLTVNGWDSHQEANVGYGLWKSPTGQTYPLPFALYDKHGEWMLTIPALEVQSMTNEAEILRTVQGPWMFRFRVL